MWFDDRGVWFWQVLCVVSSWWLVEVREVEPFDWDLSVIVYGRPCSKRFAIGGEWCTSGLLFLRI